MRPIQKLVKNGRNLFTSIVTLLKINEERTYRELLEFLKRIFLEI